MYTREECLQDVIIENLPIGEEEVIHPTGRAMSIYGLNQDNSVIVEPLMFATIELYFSKSTGRTEINILTYRFIVLNNLRGKSGTTQHDMHFSGASKVFSFRFGSIKNYVAVSQTGEYDTTNKTKYASIQEIFVGNMPKCKKLNERLWIYNMVYFLKIPILRDHNAIHTKFIWGGVEDTTLYLLEHMNAFTLRHILLLQNDNNTYANRNVESIKFLNVLLIAS